MLKIRSRTSIKYQFTEAGISLVELLVSLVILVVASTTAFSLFNISIDLSKKANKSNARQAAVETDLSAILATAERYICDLTTGSTIATCSISTSSSLPGKYDYISSRLASKDSIASLRALCRYDSSSADTPLSTTLKSIIDELDSPLNFENLGITRQPAVTTTDHGGNSLIVRWSDGTNLLYQTILTPPVSGWCP